LSGREGIGMPLILPPLPAESRLSSWIMDVRARALKTARARL
jgi:hypothetical protein